VTAADVGVGGKYKRCSMLHGACDGGTGYHSTIVLSLLEGILLRCPQMERARALGLPLGRQASKVA